MYIALPSNNSLAVLEFADRYRAKYIRTIDGLLLNRPIDLAEYGDYIFPISGHFGETLADREAGNYSLPRIGRHRQDISEIIDTEDPFTPTFENVKRPPPLRKPLRPLQVLKELQEPPKKTGITPDEPALDTKPSEEPTAGEARTGRTAPTGVGNVFGEVTDNVTPKKKRACFPAAATVLLEGGRRVAMRQLRIGDRVQASSAADGTPLFSTVYLFSHKDAEARSEFVEATFDNGWQLRLSPGHYMLIDGGLVAAGNVGVGKCLTSDRNVCVMSVRRVRDVGLFNPHTMDGRVVVDDVQVSTFTTAVAPAAARGILAPVRLLYRWHLRVAARILSGALVQGSPGRIGRLLSL